MAVGYEFIYGILYETDKCCYLAFPPSNVLRCYLLFLCV